MMPNIIAGDLIVGKLKKDTSLWKLRNVYLRIFE